MALRVPAAARQVEAADEGDAVVDDDHLLVMAGAHRMLVVEPEREPAMRFQVELVDGQPLALERVQHRVVPAEHITVQVTPGRDYGVEKVAEALGQSIIRT